MADWWVKTGSFVTPGTGTTVITVTGKGTNPKGIYFMNGYAVNDDANNNHMQSCVGFCAGAAQRSILANREKNSGTPNSFRSNSESACLRILNPANDTEVVVASAALGTNDVTITYTTFTAGHRVQYIIFGGNDCDCFTSTGVASGSPITGVGFQSNLVIWATSGNAIPATSEHSFQSVGFFHDTGAGIDQWGLFSFAGDNGALNSGSILRTADSMGQIDLDFAAWKAVGSAIGTDGFTWTGTNGDEFIYMCIRLGSDHTAGVSIGTFTKPTGAAPVTGSFSPGFTPQAYILASANEVNETDAVANDCELSWGVYDNTDADCFITTAQDQDDNDAENRFIPNEVLALSTSLLDNNVQALGTPQSITDATPDIEWNPNTANATIIGFVAFEFQPTYEQDGFRHYADGTESGAAALAAQNVDITIAKETIFGLRQGTQLVGDPPSAAVQIEYKKTGDDDAEYRKLL